MATTTLVNVTDDLDGKNGAETVTFGFQGKTYQIDLHGANLANLERSLAKYIAAGREVTPAPAGKKSKAGKASNGEAAKIRAWAVENGIAVGARGRLAPEVREAYETAHAAA